MLPAPPSSVPGETPPPPSPDPSGPTEATTTSSTSRRRTTWLLAGATAAGCAYVAISDPNNSASWYPQCPFRALTGLDCPGCGITRALHALLTGHPLRAIDHNALVMVVVVIGMVWYGLTWVRRRQHRPPPRLPHPAVWGTAAGVLVAAFWVARNLSWGPLAWLGSGAAGA